MSLYTAELLRTEANAISKVIKALDATREASDKIEERDLLARLSISLHDQWSVVCRELNKELEGMIR